MLRREMWIGGQEFSPAVVERVAAAVQEEPGISRRALSRRVCQWLGWRGPAGKLAEVSCRKALVELARRRVVALPARERPAPLARGRAAVQEPPPVAGVRCSLGELGEVEVVLVSSRWSKDSKVWNGMMEHYHPLGRGPLCGDQLRYLVRSARHGVLGGLAFSAASRRLKDRDKWIGWSEAARRANLSRVVCNSRFLLVPSVEVANLASHVLGQALSRLARDWRERYGYEPVLVESYVDPQRHRGTCYRAANWQPVGQTAGRRRGFANGTVSTGKKMVFLYPLCARWKQELGREPEDALRVRPPAGGSWVEEEFGGARVYEASLRRRLYTLVEDFFAHPGAQIPQACGGSQAKSRAAYRFFKNGRLTIERLLKGHVEATAHRVGQHQVVLAVQDTTTVNHSTHPLTEGLGPINTAADRAVGLILHDTVAFTVAGTPLGVLDAQCWVREEVDAEKTKRRKQRPIEEKESFKWLRSFRAVAEVQRLCPQTMLVSVGDRESDFHELFAEAQGTAGGPKLLVRADRGRQRKVQGEGAQEQESLWGRLSRQPVAGTVEVPVLHRPGRRARVAQMAIRHAPVVLQPPQGKNLKPVSAWAVYALEVDAPAEVKEPLEWMLLTTVEVSGFEQAAERLRWYTRRWGIEVYHRVLKSGCRIEDHRLGAVPRLENCLALDLVVAWRILWMTHQSRETPEAPCDLILEENEWKALYAVVTQRPPPAAPPPLRQAVRMIAQLGGFLGRKRDGEPGTVTLWRGLDQLQGVVLGFLTALRLAHLFPRDGP